jgi:endo-1,4-beta-xylanase
VGLGAVPEAARAEPPSAQASALAQAASAEAAARRHERLRRRSLKSARRFAAKARKSKGAGRRRLRARARRARRAAARHARKAAALRRRAALLRSMAAAAPPPPAPDPPRRPPIPLGTAVTWRDFERDPRLPSTFLRHFDQITAENEMKMFALQPRPGRFDFREADEMVNWARGHGKRVRGHTLVFGSQLPSWLTHAGFDRDGLIAVMESHIKTVVGHFRGRVAEWDVVNEAVRGDGGLQSNLWLDVIGPDYVDLAFRFAREADPGAKLFYNDGGIDLPDHPHTQGVRALLAGLRSRGVPVDGVGLQNHMSNRWYSPGPQIAEAMRRFAEMGLDIAVTEMDVRADTGGSREAELEAQRQIFAGSAAACRLQPRCTSFSTWGISDRNSWLGIDQMPLMFDGEVNPKPAFGAVEDWIKRP